MSIRWTAVIVDRRREQSRLRTTGSIDMGQAIGAILGQAVGVAISPVPIIAVILMLFSKGSKANSISFLVGWIVAVFSVAPIQ